METPNVLIAVTGSIAAYRTCDVARSLEKRKIPCSVVMTRNAERFVGRVTFEAICSGKVFTDDWEQGMVHIDARNLGALLAVVPATANILAKMAHGIADDLVSSTYLAGHCPVLVAPAMNPFMYASKPVQRNLRTLREDGVAIIDPVEGEVVCGDTGQGKMADVALIVERIVEAYRSAVQRTVA